MSITSELPLSLPAYNLVENAVAATAGGIEFGNAGNTISKNIYSSYDWSGRPVSSHPLTTPILYHRGSWQAMNRGDPEADPPSFPAENDETYQQYGTAWSETSTRMVAPRAILWNASANISSGVTTALAALSSSLATQNVFTGRMDLNFPSGLPFVSGVFPPHDIESDAAYVDAVGVLGSAVGLVDKRRLIDETRFQGGHLLCIYACQPFTGGVYGNAGYFKRTSGSGASSVFGYVVDSARADYDIGRLAACYPRFASYTMIVYFRTFLFGGNLDTSIACIAHVRSVLESQVSPYGVTMRGNYGASDDLSATIQADIQSWLATL